MVRGTHSTEKRVAGLEPQNGQSGRITNQESLNALRQWLLPNDGIFASLSFHGNTTWLPRSLVWLALCWAWSGQENVTDAFKAAVQCCDQMLERTPLTSYTGFMGALTTWSSRLINLLFQVLHARMKEIGGKFWKVGKWIAIGFDGSRSSAPRSKANEKALCPPGYGTGKTAQYRRKGKGKRKKKAQKALKYYTRKQQLLRKKKAIELKLQKEHGHAPMPQQPQAWITMMWHMGLRLPWMWRLGPSNSSEREHVILMVNEGKFPENTLFCGDAGFVGYPLWSAIRNKRHHFLVRVGANVSLLKESLDLTQQENDEVLCWPKDAVTAGSPPLRLRLVRVLIGKTKVWLLTSVLDQEDLSVEEMVKLYKMRWGIEVEFRGLKQTLGCSLLCCHNDKRLMVELDWSIMAMAIAELFGLKEQLAKKHSSRQNKQPPSHPQKRSLANIMRVLRPCLLQPNQRPKSGADLATLLRGAVTDSYIRTASKKSRHRPANPDKKPLGDPKVRQLTEKQKTKINALTHKRAT